MKPRRIHQSLLRTHTFLGCERELCMLLILISLAIALSAVSLRSLAAGLVFFAAGYFLLRQMMKCDSRLSAVYLRYVRYKRFYPAQAGSLRPGRRSR